MNIKTYVSGAFIDKVECHCCAHGHYQKIPEFDDVYSCVLCKHIYRSYNGDIDEYHREQYRKEFKTYPPIERKVYCHNLFSFFESFVDEDSELLEVGAGDGFMANMVLPYVSNICALEIDGKLIKRMEEEYPELKTAHFSFLDFNSELKFDLIYCIDVLEHVEELDKFVQKLKELGQKYVVIQVPTNRTIYNPNPKFDGHLHYFTRKSLEELFSDFELIKFKVTNRGETARGQEILTLFKIKP